MFRIRFRPLLLAVAGGCLVGSAACRVPAPAPPSPITPIPSPQAISEGAIPAPQNVKVQVTELRQTPSENKKFVTVTGTLINRGTRPTATLTVRVSGLDSNDQPVTGSYARLSSQQLAANGGTTGFEAVFANDPNVVRYHVEVMAR